jgi:tetratricopeptide (TPR) repeat protein
MFSNKPSKQTLQSILLTQIVIILLFSSSVFAQNNEIEDIQFLYDNGEFKQSVKQLDNVGIGNFTPEHFQLYVYSLANIDLDDAEEAADNAIETFSENPDMFLMHADIMGRQAQNSVFSILGYAKKAKASLETAAKLAPNEPKYLQGLMTFYMAAPSIAGGDMEQALVQAKAIAALDEELGYSAISSYHWNVDEKDIALETLKTGLEKFPESFDLMSQKANFYVSDEKYDHAIETYKNITALKVSSLPTDEITEDDAQEKYEQQKSTVLNSHYQIGRIALVSESQLDIGVKHLETYIELYKIADFDLTGLPSIDWAHLRLAGLLFEQDETVLADAAIKQIKQPKIDNMESIYKKLSKKIKRAIKKNR